MNTIFKIDKIMKYIVKQISDILENWTDTFFDGKL